MDISKGGAGMTCPLLPKHNFIILVAAPEQFRGSVFKKQQQHGERCVRVCMCVTHAILLQQSSFRNMDPPVHPFMWPSKFHGTHSLQSEKSISRPGGMPHWTTMHCTGRPSHASSSFMTSSVFALTRSKFGLCTVTTCRKLKAKLCDS
eukprot:scaffold27389_cov22-Tisochrysis_lutea.AAC.1